MRCQHVIEQAVHQLLVLQIELLTLLCALVLWFQFQHSRLAHKVLQLLLQIAQPPVLAAVSHTLIELLQIGGAHHVAIDGDVGREHIDLLQQALVLLFLLARVVDTLLPTLHQTLVVGIQQVKLVFRLRMGPCRQIHVQLGNGQAHVSFYQLHEDTIHCFIHFSTASISFCSGPRTCTYLISCGSESTIFFFMSQRLIIRSR